MTAHIYRIAVVILVALLGGAQVAEAQGILNRARRAAERGAQRAVERQAEERARQATEAAIDAMFDAGEDVVRCVFTDSACIEGAQSDGSSVILTDDEGNPVDRSGAPVDESNAEAAVVRPESPTGAAVGAANANYDFVPGERTLFEDDFSRDNVGDFPRRLEFVNGSWDIVEWRGGRYLRNLGPRHSAVVVPLPETLPETYTIEFDAHFPHGNQRLALATARPDNNRVVYLEDKNYFLVGNNRSGVAVQGEGVESLQPTRDPFVDNVVPVRIMVDGTYTKVFLGEQRVANVPNADLPRGSELWIENIYFADAENPMLIGNIRVAAGGRDLYSTLEAEGRVVTEGVYFDTGSATLKPESFAVIQEVASMLQEHPELRVLIEGHTDAEGDPASNQTLSVERANAVRTMLVGLGIDAGRLEATGFGQTRPVADNDTPEGREQNRRVELVRL